jgi:hypothetical protein
VFAPKGQRPRWEIIYDLLVQTPDGTILTYQAMGDLLGLNPDTERNAIFSPLRKAAEQHELTHKRCIVAVRGEGYKIVANPSGHLELARKHNAKANRQLDFGLSKVVNVDLSGADPALRQAVEILGVALLQQKDIGARHLARQRRTEKQVETLRRVAGDAVHAADRTAGQVQALTDRLAALEALLAPPGESVPDPR